MRRRLRPLQGGRFSVVVSQRTRRPALDEEARLELIDRLQGRGMQIVAENLAKAADQPRLVASQGRNRHYIGGRMPAATSATIRSAACNLWNPSANARTYLYESWLCNTAATAGSIALARATARGTASTTITPTLDNAIERDVATPAGVVLDLAWSVAPTISGQDLTRWNYAAFAGGGSMWPFAEEIAIPPATGIALITPVAVLFPIADLTFLFGD